MESELWVTWTLNYVGEVCCLNLSSVYMQLHILLFYAYGLLPGPHFINKTVPPMKFSTQRATEYQSVTLQPFNSLL